MTLQLILDRACLSVRRVAGGAVAEWRFAPGDIFFQGHFPSGPVLPAVVQVGAAVMLASRLLGAPQRLSEVTRAKFTNPTGPGALLRMELSVKPEEDKRHKVRAVLTDGDLPVSELVLRVEPQTEARAATKS